MSSLPERARQAATNSLNARRDTDLGSHEELLDELADEIERLRTIVDRQSKALNVCKRELILYAGEHPDDWDNGTADAIAQVDAAEKARAE